MSLFSGNARWTHPDHLPPAVVLYSYVQDLQHEYDGVDCQKDYLEHPYTSFNDSLVPFTDRRLHIENYIPFTIDCGYRPVRISLRPLKRICFSPCGICKSPSFQDFFVDKWRSLT